MCCDENDDHKSEPDKDAELLTWLYRVSLKIRADLKNTPGYNAVGLVNIDQVLDIVPESLYILLNLICMGDDFEDETDQEQLKPKLLGIIQDIIFFNIKMKESNSKAFWTGCHCLPVDMIQRTCTAAPFCRSLYQL